MDNHNQYNELLVRYLVNETNAEENVFVENWIDASEENRRHFEQLRNAWQLAGARHTLDYVLEIMYWIR
jgi:transmembrane sensor